jgi:NAD(P)H-dependent FMN reductase
MRTLAFAASHRPASFNRQLVTIAASYLQSKGHTLDLIEFGELDMPIFDDDKRERNHIPQPAHEFAERLGAADTLIISSPEYNWSIPASLKNIIDWTSSFRPVPFTDKTAFLMCATPSKRGGTMGLSHLKTSLESVDVFVFPKFFTCGEAPDVFDPGNGACDPAAQEKLHLLLDEFCIFAEKLRV